MQRTFRAVTLAAEVEASRARRSPKKGSREDEAWTRLFFETDGQKHFELASLALPAREARVGLAAHAASGRLGVASWIVREALPRFDEELTPERLTALVAGWCDALFDGYALACALSKKGGDGTGRALKRPADVTRFARGAVALALEIKQWMHLELLRALVGEDRVVPALIGVQLHGVEFPKSHPDLVALAKGKAAKVVEPVSRHVELDPKLLAAVFASPEDDRPRLVLADWLTERGDARGEFIHLQCRLGRWVDDQGQPMSMTGRDVGEVRDEKVREVALLKAHQATWAAGLKGLPGWAWRRGFPALATGSPELLARFSKALEAFPLERFFVSRGDLKALRKTPPHPTARGFNLSNTDLHGEGFAALDVPWLSKAQELDLWGNDFSDVSTLVKCRLPELRRLRVTTGRMTDAGLAELMKAPWAKQLTHLAVNGSITSLAPLTSAKKLQWLDAPVNEKSAKELGARKGLRVRFHDGEPAAVKKALTAAYGPSAPQWDELA